MKNKIVELAFLRNHLLSNVFTEEDRKLMKRIKENILNSDTPFREIAINAITNCENDIEKNDLDSAVNEINLIHDFHFNDPKTWDSNYFYSIELSSYLEKTSDTKRVKHLIYDLACLQDKLDNSKSMLRNK